MCTRYVNKKKCIKNNSDVVLDVGIICDIKRKT